MESALPLVQNYTFLGHLCMLYRRVHPHPQEPLHVLCRYYCPPKISLTKACSPQIGSEPRLSYSLSVCQANRHVGVFRKVHL